MSKYFGTDGFRGEANVGLTVEHAYRIGRFLGWYYGREHKCSVVIGKDTRRSSYMFENALSAGLTASGADAYLMHVTTTPSVSYIVRSDDFDCGIMISASHNPFTDNGIKLLNSAGEKMEQSVIDEIENYLDGNLEIPFATDANIGRTQDYSAGRNRYIGYLISLSTHSYKGMKVGLDCANGSTWMMAKNIFDALGADTYVIGNEPDGTNINRDCGSTHIENLQKYVRLNRLDVGFAFDGDADRCLAVDENGSVVNGDKILYVCARNMQTEGRFGNSKVVTTVMSNLGLYKALDEAGIGYEKTDVGDKYVAENMRANGHLIGGEQSGHIIFGKYANTGDGLLTAIKLMQVMLDRKKALSELAAPVREYPQQFGMQEYYAKEYLQDLGYSGASGWGYHNDVLYKETLRLLEAGRKDKMLLVTKTLDMHQPYPYYGISWENMPPAVRDHELVTIRGMYWVDQTLKNFFEEAEAKGLMDDRTLFIITADHNPHSGGEYTKIVTNENDRKSIAPIPLLFVSKNLQPLNNLMTKDYASQIDLAPTLLYLAGLKAPEDFMGRNLLESVETPFALGYFGGKAFYYSADLSFEDQMDNPSPATEYEDALTNYIIHEYSERQLKNQ